jgi:glycosyltransferase involved in cell wall biosynthesis
MTATEPSELDIGMVSCLCVTRGRFEQLEHALRCYERQTYRNRELVLVFVELDERSRNFLSYWKERVALCQVPAQPLGGQRNRALEAAHGEFFTTWDDDDWYAPRRLEDQLRAMVSARADGCILSRELIQTQSAAFLGRRGLWLNGLVFRSDLDVVRAGYPDTKIGHEDGPFYHNLASRYLVTTLEAPELYVYRQHNVNGWLTPEWIGRKADPLPPEDVARLRSITL